LRVDATCGADGARTVHVTQSRFLLTGSAPGDSHWIVPIQVRIGSHGESRSQILSGEPIPAGTCAEALSLNADAIGFYRVEYDAATLQTNTTHFGELPDGDRIALLDDEWALVLAGAQPLKHYLALASHMDGDLDTRAWQQIGAALGEIEYDDRGRPGQDAFNAFARSVLAPALAALGADAKDGEPPDRQELRRTLIHELGVLGDTEVIRVARQRFEAFLKDPASLPASDQPSILAVVARDADVATFEQLHELARGAKNIAELERYYGALGEVRDPKLAQQAADIVFSSEIPPQAIQARVAIIGALTREHPALGWQMFSEHAHELLQSQGTFEPLFEAQYVPQIFWNSAPLDQIEAWVRSKVPAEMAPQIERGMSAARLMLEEKERLAQDADQF
jgi:aminopeptidase N